MNHVLLLGKYLHSEWEVPGGAFPPGLVSPALLQHRDLMETFLSNCLAPAGSCLAVPLTRGFRVLGSTPHPGTKHRPGQGVRESERGNSAGAMVAALLIAVLCQQGGPADRKIMLQRSFPS